MTSVKTVLVVMCTAFTEDRDASRMCSRGALSSQYKSKALVIEVHAFQKFILEVGQTGLGGRFDEVEFRGIRRCREDD